MPHQLIMTARRISLIPYDLLDSSEIENILENSDFVLMLNQGASDRNILAQRLGISPQELNHVTNSGEGESLRF